MTAPDPSLLAPLDDAAWPESAPRLLGGFAGRLNVYRVMAHNPALLLAWETLRNHVVLDSALTPEQSEIVILRVGVRRGSRYEWIHHVLRGLDAGLDPARIFATRDPAAAGEGEDALLIAAVDSIVDRGYLPPPILAALTGRIGPVAVLDVMATVGMYSTLACILESYRVPVEPEILDAFGATSLSATA